MDSTGQPPISLGEIVVTLVIGSAALVVLGLQPLLLGEMEETKAISGEGVGMVAMCEIFALGLGVALADALLPISRHKLVAMVAALVAAIADVATPYVAGDAGFAAVRAADGLAEGVLLWTATSVIVRSASPERVAAVFLVVQTVVQAGVAALLAWLVIPQASWQGGFKLLAALMALCIVLAVWLPPRLVPLQTHDAEKLRWTLSRVVPLGVAFLQLAALVSLWAYVELLGKAAGLNAGDARFIPTEVLVMQVLGGLAATWAVRHFPTAPTLAAGSVVLAAVAAGIYFLPNGSARAFTLLCGVFGFAWLFLLPFHVSLAFRADAKGRVAVLVPAAQLIGSAAGPFAASLTLNGNDAGTVPLVSLSFAAGAAFLVTAGRRLWVADASAASKMPSAVEDAVQDGLTIDR
jgi:MFS family permease